MDSRAAVDYAFGFYERFHQRQQGRLDREVRRPDLFGRLLAARALSPPRDSTILVTGSKGKGSTARLAAWGLQAQSIGRVGLLLSPEECSHFDRIRIDNRPIDPEVFGSILSTIRNDLDALQEGAPNTFYVPPTAVFLTVALEWWRAEGVSHCVIEGGRGVRWDEIGEISARVGVVSSILPEHLDKLGPTLADVAADKLSLAGRVDHLVCPADPEVVRWSERCVPHRLSHRLDFVPCPPHATNWYEQACLLASRACSLIVGNPVDVPRWPVPSMQSLRITRTPDSRACDTNVMFDGAVLPECLPVSKPDSSTGGQLAIVVGLPDSKDALGIMDAVRALGPQRLLAVPLVSAVGHVQSHWTAHAPAGVSVLSTLDVVNGATDELRRAISDTLREHSDVLFVGVQTYLRSVRNSLGVPICGPGRADMFEGEGQP